MTDRHLAPVDLDEPDDPYAGPAVPQDRDAEVAVLGACLLGGLRGDVRPVHEVAEVLGAGDFYTPRHELIFHAITALVDAGEIPDPIVVADHLGKTGQLKRAGGPAYLHQLGQAVVTSANAAYFAEIVHERAGKRRLVEAGTRIMQLGTDGGDGDVADLFARAESEVLGAKALSTPRGEQVVTSWAPLNLAEILEHGEVVDRPLILPRSDGHCLFYRGAVHSISGEPESGKSWLAFLGCASELIKGEQATVVDFEDRPGRVVSRLLALGVPKAAIRERFHYIRPHEALSTAAASTLDDVVVSSTIVVLDGITEAMSLHGLEINAQEDVARFLLMLPRRIADLGPAVVQIDHVAKNGEAGNRFSIGAQHKLAGLDGAAYMVKVVEPFARGKSGRARVTVVKDREGGVREHASGTTVAELILDSSGFAGALRYELEAPHGVTRSDATGQMRPTGLMEKVSRVIEGDPGLSGKQVEAAVKGRTDYKRLALRTLVAEGFVSTENGDRGAVFYHSTTPYREASDDQQ